MPTLSSMSRPVSAIVGITGISARSIQLGMAIPPLHVTARVGACGCTNTTPGSARAIDDVIIAQPCGVSPRPWLNTTAARAGTLPEGRCTTVDPSDSSDLPAMDNGRG